MSQALRSSPRMWHPHPTPFSLEGTQHSLGAYGVSAFPICSFFHSSSEPWKGGSIHRCAGEEPRGPEMLYDSLKVVLPQQR